MLEQYKTKRFRINRPVFLQFTVVFVGLIASLFVFSKSSYAQEEFPEGSLWRPAGNNSIYVISNGRKRLITNEKIFNSYGWNLADVREADSDILLSIPDIRVIKITGSSTVYSIISGYRVPLASTEDFTANGFTWDEVATVNKTELESYALQNFDGTIAPLPPEPVEPLLLQKLTEARKLLHAAPPIYPQEKRVTRTTSYSSGSSGMEIEKIQLKLQALGYFPKTIAANGNFGPATLRAVKAFQKSQGIIQNGVIGPLTMTALQKKGLTLPASGSIVKEWRDTIPQDREVLLTVWNQKTDELNLVSITLKSERVKVGRTYRTVSRVVTKTPGFTVHYKGGNGVNVQYTVTSPTSYKVLANRFPIFDQASGKIGTFPPDEEVYIPYSDEFLAPEIVAAGRKYLDDVVNEALDDLRKKGVESVSGKGLIADLTDFSELKNIAIIEHIDHGEFNRAVNKNVVVNKVFAMLATNREDAYRFSGSSKGALGLAQFIRSTYVSITKKYPQAKLIPDFQAGMADHVNAFQAMALYNDLSGVTLESVVSKKITDDPVSLASAMAEVRAAAYNGGAGRVKTAINKFGDKWKVTVNSRYGLRAETRTYLKKFEAVQLILAMDS